MSNHIMRRYENRGRHKGFKKKRPKTFRSEQVAKAYAEQKGIKNYELKNLRIDPRAKPKIRIVEKA